MTSGGRQSVKRGLFVRYKVGHANRKSLESRYILDEELGCWLWRGKRDSNGYGQVRVGDRLQMAHRTVYEQFNGPIPEGKGLDHLCRVRNCVNPDHLEPVSSRENTRRGFSARLFPAAIEDIRTSSLPKKDLAAKWGISTQSVWRIRTGKQWAD